MRNMQSTRGAKGANPLEVVHGDAPALANACKRRIGDTLHQRQGRNRANRQNCAGRRNGAAGGDEKARGTGEHGAPGSDQQHAAARGKGAEGHGEQAGGPRRADRTTQEPGKQQRRVAQGDAGSRAQSPRDNRHGNPCGNRPPVEQRGTTQGYHGQKDERKRISAGGDLSPHGEKRCHAGVDRPVDNTARRHEQHQGDQTAQRNQGRRRSRTATVRFGAVG